MSFKDTLRLYLSGLFVLVLLTAGGILHAEPRPALLFRAIDSEPLNHVTAGAQILRDGWLIGQEIKVGNDGVRFSSPTFGATDWYPTTVPTTVLGAMVRLGKYPDPYVNRNDEQIPDASDPNSPWSKPWWFRRNFTLPAGQAGKTVWLHLDGINYRAAIWINGRQVASEKDVVGMFRRYRFDITSFVDPGKPNAIAIRIFPDDWAGKPGNRVAGSDIDFQRNVTEMSALGWDWVPTARDRNMGIWQDVWIEATGPVATWDPAAFTDVQLPGGKQAALTLRVTLQNAAKKPEPVDVVAEIQPRGFPGPTIRVVKQVVLPEGATREIVLKPQDYPALILHHPHLWWPHGYGDQPLYQLTVQTRVSGVLSHTQVTQFGVRTIGYYYNPEQYAHTLDPVPGGTMPLDYPRLKTARVFTVNGRPIRAVGGAMVPDLMLSWNAENYRDQVRMMTEGNHTIVRIWGGGIIMPDAFYDEADRQGLLVWQDLARSSFAVAWNLKAASIPNVDKDIYLANMRDTIMRLRGRTSLLAWCGTNEAPMQDDIGQALQDQLLPQLDGTRPWIPSTSTEPVWARESLGMRSFGPYSLQSIHYYFDQYAHNDDFRFKNEIGLESVPRRNTLQRAIPEAGTLDASGNWISQDLLFHGLPAASLVPRMQSSIGNPASLADFLGMAELLSGQAYRAIYEAANKNRPRNSGTMIWMTNAAWPDCMFQLYDWFLRPTAGYYAVKASTVPLHVQYAPDDHTLQVVSILAQARHLHVRATLSSMLGKTEQVKEYEVTAAADATTAVGAAPSAIADGKLHFLTLELTDDQGKEIDRSVHWTQEQEQWKDLLRLDPVRVRAQVVSKVRSRNDETEYRVRITNEGHVPAVDVWVAAEDGPLGEEILPSFWSANALNLMPGEQRVLTVTMHSTKPSVQPRFRVEGFNVTPAEYSSTEDAAPEPLAVKVIGMKSHRRGAQNLLEITLTQSGEKGPCWVTWPLELRADGKMIRTFRVALHTGTVSTVDIPVGQKPSQYQIGIGGKTMAPGSGE